MPARKTDKTDKTAKPSARKSAKRTAAQGNAATTLPGLQRSVKWGMSYYGVGDGWCFCCGGFAGHVKLMFVNGAALQPVPPVTPMAMGKSTRGVELESVDDLDKRQIAA